jgi:uncharacterized protein YfaS (alpha-2-macroglobulin family)
MYTTLTTLLFLVLFQQCATISFAVAATPTIKKPAATVVFDKTSYYPGQTALITVTINSTITDSAMTFFYATGRQCNVQ